MTAPAARSDHLVFPLLLIVRDCVEQALASTPSGPPARSYVWWGAQPPIMDGCTCGGTDAQGRTTNGDGWVRLVTSTPEGVTARGAGAGAATVACPTGWVLTLGIGFYRCVPVSGTTGPLPADSVTGISAAMHDGRMALEDVMLCCPIWGGEGGPPSLGQPEPVAFTPIRRADCGGGEWTFRVPVTGLTPCEEPGGEEPQGGFVFA